MYRRNDIVVERDLSEATARMDQYFGKIKSETDKRAESLAPNELGTLLGTPERAASRTLTPPISDEEPEPNPKQ